MQEKLQQALGTLARCAQRSDLLAKTDRIAEVASQHDALKVVTESLEKINSHILIF